VETQSSTPKRGFYFFQSGGRCGVNIIKIVIGLLFLAIISSGLAIGNGNHDATIYSDINGNWIMKADAPTAGGYGEAVVSTATNI